MCADISFNHSIVGKGNHSPHHITKIKPAVEQICQMHGLQYSTEPNAGRIYINLQGGEAHMPEQFLAHNGGGYGQGYGGGRPYQGHQQQYYGGGEPQMAYQHGGSGGQHYGGGGQQHHQQHQQQNPNAEVEAEVKKYLPKVLRVIKRQCCTVM